MCQFRKFYIRAVFLDTKLVVLGLPEGLTNKPELNVYGKIMLIMEIKLYQLLFTVQKRTIRCNLEIAKYLD